MFLELEVEDDFHEVSIEKLSRVLLLLLKFDFFVSCQFCWPQWHDQVSI